ncbi:MAG: recombinase family protein, partial [Rickettsiales bacterium]|nr:recombinase family protein [Rickettsiales bacterium]
MKTAVIYARYSSDSQTEQSIEGQLRVCQDYAKQNDILIVDAYIDRAMSGTNDNRPAFQKMIHDSEKQKWTYVVVYKLDRFARNKYESVINKKRLQDNGVKLVSAMENITDSPEGRMMECFLEGMNQYFSEELTQKVRRGLNESWLKGNATGGPKVFGYDVIDKKYVINEKEAAVVQEIFTLFANGYTSKEIAQSLQEKGIRYQTGDFINHKKVLKLLSKRKYTGKVERNGVVYENIFPQIISDELWQKIEMIHEKNKKSPSSKKAEFDFLLTGKLVCGKCHRPMIGTSGVDRHGRIHYYYICSSRKHRANCQAKMIHKFEIEDLVINTTMALIADDNAIGIIADSVFETICRKQKDDSALKLLEKNKSAAQKSARNIISAMEQGIITDMTKERLQELEAQISQYDFEIEREKNRHKAYVTKDTIKNYIKTKFGDNANDVDFRKMIVNTFIREIIYHEDKIIVAYNFEDPSEPTTIDMDTTMKMEEQSESALSVSTELDIAPSRTPTTSQEVVFLLCTIRASATTLLHAKRGNP